MNHLEIPPISTFIAIFDPNFNYIHSKPKKHREQLWSFIISTYNGYNLGHAITDRIIPRANRRPRSGGLVMGLPPVIHILIVFSIDQTIEKW